MSKDKVWERETKDFRDPEARAWARLGIEDPHQVLGETLLKTQVETVLVLEIQDGFHRQSAELLKF